MREFRRLAVPQHAHPLVRQLFALMLKEQCSVAELAERSGVQRETIRNWRHHSNPRLADIIACYNVFDLDLVVRRVKEKT